ncbi:MAG: flagellar biosynthetic protein FliO [Spirochaetia bacterium]|nr:flagellar biosynthetic protein FliO [Spirochaetia bacterium]
MMGYLYRFLILFFTFFLLTSYAAGQSKTPETKANTVDKSVENNQPIKTTETSGDKEKTDFEKSLEKELKETGEPVLKREKISWVWQFIKTLLVLFGLIVFFYFIWKVFLFKRNLPILAANVFKLWHEFPVQPNKSLQIIEVGNKFLILGISEAGIQLVTEISEKSAIDQIKLDCERESQMGKPDFLLELSKAVRHKVKGWVSPEKNMQKETLQNKDFWENTRQKSMGKLSKIKSEKDSLR